MTKLISLAILVIACAGNAYAQSGPTGIWRVTDVSPPPTLVLRADGSVLIGTVRVGGTRDISDGRIEGNTITFNVVRPAGDLTVSFRGTITADEIVFTRELHPRAGATTPPNPILKLEAFPARFTVRRIPNSELTAQDKEQIFRTDQIPGIEIAAAANFIQQDFKAVGTLFIPTKVQKVTAIIVVVHYGLGQEFFWDGALRKVAESTGCSVLLAGFPSVSTPVGGTRPPSQGAAEGLSALVQRLAQESGHKELVHAPMLFWGHSAAGAVAAGFAGADPKRTVGFIRYNSGPVTGTELKVLTGMPALLLAAEQDSPSGTVAAAETLWKAARLSSAPWTFALIPEAHHGRVDDLRAANALMLPWIAAVLRQRVDDGGALRSVSDGEGWLGSLVTRDVASVTSFGGLRSDATWLPDEATAGAWRTITAVK